MAYLGLHNDWKNGIFPLLYWHKSTTPEPPHLFQNQGRVNMKVRNNKENRNENLKNQKKRKNTPENFIHQMMLQNTEFTRAINLIKTGPHKTAAEFQKLISASETLIKNNNGIKMLITKPSVTKPIKN
jgi:hypothetical protein